MKHYELQLLNDYKIDKVIDCKNARTAFLFSLISFIISILFIVIGLVISLTINNGQKEYFDGIYALLTLVFFGAYIITIVAHELIHGLFYKIYTKQKLTFGITLGAAYCGVPNIYLRRKAMIITCIAPCIIISTIYLILMVIFIKSILFILFVVLFSMHFGGCIGDLYDFLLLLFKYKNKDILINDTGTKQTIYMKKPL